MEIDQIRDTEAPAPGLCAGTATICIVAAGAAPDDALRPAEGPLADLAVQPRIGVAGERVALLYAPTNSPTN